MSQDQSQHTKNLLKDAVHAFVEFTRIQMGITGPIIIYYSWEEVEHFNYPIPNKIHYNKLLGWSDKINGNHTILINLRMHQSFQTIFRTIVHELFHIKFPKINDEGQIETYTNRWLETRHTEFGFYYDDEFMQSFKDERPIS